MPATELHNENILAGEHIAAALREAGELALKTFRGNVRSWTKGGASPVCEADIAVDRFLRGRLAGAAPNYGWLSEESKDDPARLDAKRVWVVDPIDGTRAYLAGYDDWSISAALVDNGRPVAGAIYAPVHDEMFTAVAGEGARRNGIPVGASTGDELSGARIAGPRSYLDRMATLAPQIRKMPKIHSLALRFVRVAQGALDVAFASVSSHDWDLAAADLLVHEAGGALTTFTGERVQYNRPEPVHEALVAAGHVRHRAMLALVRGRGAEFK